MLTKIKIPLPDILKAVLALDATALDIDQVENLIKLCPTKEEMETLKNYTGNKEMLGKCELV
ncbi:formin-like protein 14, partial [Tanacetum coccineum]